MNAIQREFRLHWRQDALLYAVYWAIYTAVISAVCLIVYLVDSSSYADMGCFMSMLAGVIMLLLRFVLWQPYYFNLAVGMGRTRTSAMLSTAAHSAFLTALFAVTLLLFQWIEQQLYSHLFPAAFNELSFADILSPLPQLGIAAVLWVVTFVLSGMIVRYGRKAWWAVWAMWMFGCLVLPRLFHADDAEKTSLLGRLTQGLVTAITTALGSVAPAVWWTLGIAALAAALAAGVRMYLRAEVRG